MVSAKTERPKSAALDVLPARPWRRWIASVLVVACTGMLIYKFGSSDTISWSSIPEYVLNRNILSGLAVTVQLTVLCMIIGIVLGVVAAVMRLSRNPVFRVMSAAYIGFFRGVPLLVQILFWFNIALFVPEIDLGFGPVSTNYLVTSFVAAVLALSLHEGAYMAEIVRAGITSIDQGQWSASQALGLNRAKIYRLVVLPQAVPAMIPPTGNRLIGMLKGTSLVSVIAASELLTEAQTIYTRNYLIMELLMVVSIWYLVLTALASIGLRILERRLLPAAPQAAGGQIRRLLKDLSPFGNPTGGVRL